MTNQLTFKMANDLRKASSKNDAAIWKRLAEFALKPSSVRRVVNLYKLSEQTNDGDVVVVPGKVLGTGSISHKITLCSFSISNGAASKIIEAEGNIIPYTELVEKYPTGKGVKILG